MSNGWLDVCIHVFVCVGRYIYIFLVISLVDPMRSCKRHYGNAYKILFSPSIGKTKNCSRKKRTKNKCRGNEKKSSKQPVSQPKGAWKHRTASVIAKNCKIFHLFLLFFTYIQFSRGQTGHTVYQGPSHWCRTKDTRTITNTNTLTVSEIYKICLIKLVEARRAKQRPAIGTALLHCHRKGHPHYPQHQKKL